MAEISDLIFANPALTEADRNFANAFFNANIKKYEDKLKDPIFQEINRSDIIKKIDGAIKAVLFHKINSGEKQQ